MNNRIVDADSQFTRRVPIGSLSWEVDQRLDNLIRARSISFGHKTFGQQHYTFFVLLRRFNETNQTDLLRDVVSRSVDALGGAPDLILYPGESTAAYMILRLSEAFQATPPPLPVMLNPAFRQYGSSELRLEFPHRNTRLKDETIRVLFFDDSISYGTTESLAIKAARGFCSNKVRWLSYVVLWRGNRTASRERLPPADAWAAKLEYKSHFYCTIGPQTLTHGDCPMCPAVARLRLAYEWAGNCRSGILDRLETALKLLEAHPLEEIASELSILDGAQTAHLLFLESLPIHEVGFHFTSLTGPSRDQAAAIMMFLALHFVDLSSYLTVLRFQTLMVEAIEETSVEEAVDGPMLIALAILPTSVVGFLAPKLIDLFLQRHDPDKASAVAALIIANHHVVLRSTANDVEATRRRQDSLIHSLIATLPVAEETSQSYDSSEVALVEKDIRMLAYGNKESIIRLAHDISVLLGEGRHELFLRRQLETLSEHKIKEVCINLNHVLDLIMQLSATTSVGLESEILQAKSDLSNIACGSNVTLFRNKADFWLTRLWTESPLSQLLYWPLNLSDWMEQAFSRLQNEVALDRTTLVVIEPTADDRGWLCFGPPGLIVRDHFLNLLRNAFTYSNLAQSDEGERVASGAPSGLTEPAPIKVCFWRTADRLTVIVADRGQRADRSQLFSGAGGLASARAQFSFYGGSVSYEMRPSSEPGLDKVLSEQGIYTPLYNNIFTTQFALLLKVNS